MLAQEIIRRKRDGGTLAGAEVEAFVRGLVDGSWSEGQVAALAMAIVLRGMSRTECVDLTRAMTRSGEVLDWSDAALTGPVIDKPPAVSSRDTYSTSTTALWRGSTLPTESVNMLGRSMSRRNAPCPAASASS